MIAELPVLPPIDPDRMYLTSEARLYIPSTNRTGPVCRETMLDYLHKGILKGERARPGSRFWRIRGSELIRFLKDIGVWEHMDRTEAALAVLRAHGCKLQNIKR